MLVKLAATPARSAADPWNVGVEHPRVGMIVVVGCRGVPEGMKGLEGAVAADLFASAGGRWSAGPLVAGGVETVRHAEGAGARVRSNLRQHGSVSRHAGEVIEQSADRDADRRVDDQVGIDELVGRRSHHVVHRDLDGVADRVETSCERLDLGVADVGFDEVLAYQQASGDRSRIAEQDLAWRLPGPRTPRSRNRGRRSPRWRWSCLRRQQRGVARRGGS